MSDSDKRAAGRVPVVLRIRLQYADIDTFIEKFATNVSRGGMFIASRTPKPIGTVVRFELRLADDSPLIVGQGVVRWVRAFDPEFPRRPHGMGIQFGKLDPTSTALLERIVDHRRRLGLVDDHEIPLRRPRAASEPAVPAGASTAMPAVSTVVTGAVPAVTGAVPPVTGAVAPVTAAVPAVSAGGVEPASPTAVTRPIPSLPPSTRPSARPRPPPPPPARPAQSAPPPELAVEPVGGASAPPAATADQAVPAAMPADATAPYATVLPATAPPPAARPPVAPLPPPRPRKAPSIDLASALAAVSREVESRAGADDLSALLEGPDDLGPALRRAQQMSHREREGGGGDRLDELLRVSAAPVAETVDDASAKLARMLGGAPVRSRRRRESVEPPGLASALAELEEEPDASPEPARGAEPASSSLPSRALTSPGAVSAEVAKLLAEAHDGPAGPGEPDEEITEIGLGFAPAADLLAGGAAKPAPPPMDSLDEDLPVDEDLEALVAEGLLATDAGRLRPRREGGEDSFSGITEVPALPPAPGGKRPAPPRPPPPSSSYAAPAPAQADDDLDGDDPPTTIRQRDRARRDSEAPLPPLPAPPAEDEPTEAGEPVDPRDGPRKRGFLKRIFGK